MSLKPSCQNQDRINCQGNVLFVVSASLEAFCTLHPDSALANPQHCGQYYKCSPAGSPPTAVSECVYPQEFSISGKVCRPYTDVDCAERVEKVRGCEY